MAQQFESFSKSRYFPRKRMRSVDFIRDQEYVDHKLAFLSRWDLGTGIALGLEAQRIDGKSMLVSPGFAVDGVGRWLIVDEPAICQIRTLPGFNTLQGENALVWLTYREEPIDPMFNPDSQEGTPQFAAVRERFSFYLTDMRSLPGAVGDQVLFSDTILFEDDDLRVRQVIPRVLPAQGRVQLRLILESFCLEPLEACLRYAPELPGFQPVEGALSLDQTLRLEKGETVLAVTGTLSTTAQAVLLSLSKDKFQLEKRGVRLWAQRDFREEFPVVAGDPIKALEELLLARDPKELLDDGAEEGVPIAGIRLIRCGDQLLLDDIIPLSKERHAVLPCLRERLRRCADFFPPAPVEPPEQKPEDWPPSGPPPEPPRRMTTGTVTLYTGLHLEEGEILRSEEISHGFGPGVVFVEFGVENVYPAPEIDRNYTDLLLGDPSLFTQASGTYDLGFDRGVRVHPEKGTFEMAIRLRGELRQASLRLRWFAWQAGESREPRPAAGTLLRLEPDVVHAAPGETVNFVPVFEHGLGAPCDFLIQDKRSGLIDLNGIYTAPEKEGLYQVYAQVKNMPETRVSAFVIVRARMEESGHVQGAL